MFRTLADRHAGDWPGTGSTVSHFHLGNDRLTLNNRAEIHYGGPWPLVRREESRASSYKLITAQSEGSPLFVGIGMITAQGEGLSLFVGASLLAMGAAVGTIA